MGTYAQARRLTQAEATGMHTTIIINPRGSRRVRQRLHGLARPDRLTELRYTRAPGHATEIARRAVAQGSRMIVAVGGDGTVNEVLNGTVRTDVTVGMIPAGSANDLATHHGIPADVDDAWAVVRNHATRPVDLISVNGWVYATGGGIGLPADVVQRVNALRGRSAGRRLPHHPPHGMVYAAALTRILIGNRLRPLQLKIQNGNGRRDVTAVALLVNNQPRIGRYFQLTPGACTEDGECDACLLYGGRTSAYVVPVIARACMGSSSIASPRADVWRARELHVHSEVPVQFMGDGEMQPPESDFTIRVLPAALRLAVPHRSGE
jgi:diacylglycerol kinase (ATP)